MATRVVFNLLGQSAHCPFLDHAHQLLVELSKTKQPVLVVANDQNMLEQLSELLWQKANEHFIAYGIEGEPTAGAAQVLIASTFEVPSKYRQLLNLSSKLPSEQHRFQQIVELVTDKDEAVEAARERYKHYRQQGFTIEHIKHDKFVIND
jgi:DNA polymerase III subunit chi